MDFNITKLVGDAQHYAGAFINRAKQMTEEAIYSSEKTNLDPQLESLCKQADEAKNWTQRIVRDIESVLTPNPGQRVEDFVLEKIDKKRSTRMSNMEVLGQGMIEAGNEFGRGGAFGSMLVKVGTSELKLGQTEREFITVAVTNFVDPLNRFLENEIKNASKERRTLETKRLDLDAAKNKLRKARSLSSQPVSKDGTDPRFLIQQAEREVIQSQTDFNQQSELTKVQLEVLMASRDRLVENLKTFVQAQTTYFARCHQLMLEMNKELDTMPLSSVNLAQSFSIDDSMLDDSLGGNPNGIQMKVRVMFDFVATGPDEISVFANEMFNVSEAKDSEYFIAYKGGSTGKIPKACVLVL